MKQQYSNWGDYKVWHHATIDREHGGMSMSLGDYMAFFLWREARFYVEMYKWIRTHKMWDDVMYATTHKGKITTTDK